MMNETNITSAKEQDYLLQQVPLLVLHWLALLVLLLLAKVTRDTCETTHPVFAVISQEIWMLGCCDLICCISIFWLCGPEKWAASYFFALLGDLTLQFHQISWLVITCLR